MKKSLTYIVLFSALVMLSACTQTWDGAKKDTKESVDWSKEKVNDGAKYIEKKTE